MQTVRERKTVSFVVRLTSEPRELDSPDSQPLWKGLVQHVQSGEELRFIRMEDLYAFIEDVTSRAAALSLPPG